MKIGSLTFSFFLMFLNAVLLGGGPAQVSSRLPRSSLSIAKACWYASFEGGGEAMALAARTAGTAGASDKVALISPPKKNDGRLLGWSVMLTGR